MRRITILLAATAILAIILLPAVARAGECTYGGQTYTEGAVVNGQQCTCAGDHCWWEQA